MYCKYCGNQIDNDSAFCNYCGKPPSSAAAQKMREVKPQKATPYVKTPLKTSKIYNAKPGGSWKPFAFISLVIWLLSAVLAFVDWFSIDLLYYSRTFSIFDMSSMEEFVEEYSSENVFYGEISSFFIVFGLVFLILAIVTIVLLIVGKRAVFFTGIGLSVVSIIYPILIISLVSDYFINYTAAPIIMIVINIAAIVLLLVGNAKFVPTAKKSVREKGSGLHIGFFVCTAIVCTILIIAGISLLSFNGVAAVAIVLTAIGGFVCGVIFLIRRRKKEPKFILYCLASFFLVMSSCTLMGSVDSVVHRSYVDDDYREEYYDDYDDYDDFSLDVSGAMEDTIESNMREDIAYESSIMSGGIKSMVFIYLIPYIAVAVIYVFKTVSMFPLEITRLSILVTMGTGVLAALFNAFACVDKTIITLNIITGFLVVAHTLGVAAISGFCVFDYFRSKSFKVHFLNALWISHILSSVTTLFNLIVGAYDVNFFMPITLVFIGVILMKLTKLYKTQLADE